MKRYRTRRHLLMWILFLGIPMMVILSLFSGSVQLPLESIELVISELKGNEIDWQQFSREEIQSFISTRSILLEVRLPRILAALLAGAALAISGATMQGLFQNPMASPEILGISAGASLGAVITISFGLSYKWSLPGAAMIGGICSSAFVYLIASRRGKTHLLFLILGGLAISSLINGMVSTVLILSKEYEVKQFIHWTMGSLDNQFWIHLRWPAPIILLGIIALCSRSNALNLLTQGEEQAHGLGLAVERNKLFLLFTSTILTAMAISLAGPVAFIGLLVPHLVRLLVGPDHKILLPLSAVSGAFYLLLCDWLARRLFAPREFETGIITALIGAPYFIFLILRYQRKGVGR